MEKPGKEAVSEAVLIQVTNPDLIGVLPICSCILMQKPIHWMNY